MNTLLQDLRYALRQLRKNPGFALVAILTLALGIGANTAVFSAVDAVLLKPLPFAHPERLLAVDELDTRGVSHQGTFSYPDFFDWRAQNHTLAHLVSYRYDQFALSGQGKPRQIGGVIASWDLFPALGVQPSLGRGFTASEEQAGAHVAVISHGLWKQQFGGDPHVIGRVISLERRPCTIIGVMPAGFRFPVENPDVQIWTTLSFDAFTNGGHPMTEQRGARLFDALGVLRPGVTEAQARADLSAIAARLAQKYPGSNAYETAAWVQPELTGVTGPARPALLILLGAVGLVLLIACANIANLLLARATKRQREIGLRMAIGASRKRIVRQLLTESLALAVLGGAGGVLLAKASVALLVRLAGDSVPRLAETAINGPVLLFALGLALVTAALFGLAPAFQTTRVDLVETLKNGGYGSTLGREQLRRALVAGEVALGLILLAGAGVLIGSFVRMQNRTLGFRPDHLLTFSFELPQAKYTEGQSIDFERALISHICGLPGVRSAAGVFSLPLSGSDMNGSFNIEERPTPKGRHPAAQFSIVTPGYFHAMGIPVLEGRDFNAHDDVKTTPVAVVNQSFARRFFPGEDVIGKRIQPGASDQTGPAMHTIIGVVGDSRFVATQAEMPPMYYLVYPQLAWGTLTVVTRTSVAPMSLVPAMRAQVSALDPDEPIYDVRTMDELVANGMAQPRFQMILLGSFAAMALLLTLVGLYGVMSWSVARRTREIGVRMALGAPRPKVLRMVLSEALRLLAIGIGIGIAGSLAGARLLSALLFGVDPRSPQVLAGVCALMIVAGLLAALVPAWRAATIEPVEALRTE